MREDILQVRELRRWYPVAGGNVYAVDGLSFSIAAGSTMGLVGESGCGKSTAGRAVLRLGAGKTQGEVRFEGRDIYALSRRQLRALRPRMQMVFQDPFSSLSPRMPVGQLLGEAVKAHRLVAPKEMPGYIDAVMESCGLQPFHKNRYPHEFSGGQRQRISIARALAMKPRFVVCDEMVSALDVSVQAQIINLLQDLQSSRGLTYLFISHDLSVVEHITDTVGVMYLGSFVEYAPTKALFQKPLHPYTQALFSAIPMPDPDYKMERTVLGGSLPSPTQQISGCKFHTRCPHAMTVCTSQTPRWLQVEEGHFCACHLYDEGIEKKP